MIVADAKMKPGDLVAIIGQPSIKATCLVISVQQSKQVPDANVRGLANVYPWRYWVFDGTKVLGPMNDTWLTHVN
jgi:hypothetical protein